MLSSARPATFKILISLCVLTGLCFHIYFSLLASKAWAPTFDEPEHISAGYAYLKTGDFRRIGLTQAPLGEMWVALPLLFKNLRPLVSPLPQNPPQITMRDQYEFGNDFIFHNLITADEIIFSGRKMQLVLSVGVGLVLLFVGTELGGVLVGLLAFCFWAFSPTYLTQSAIISTDLIFSLFLFLFFYTAFTKEGWSGSVFTGIFLGLMMASKFFFIVIFPILAVMAIWKIGQRDFRFLNKNWALRCQVVFIISCLVLMAVYRFTSFKIVVPHFVRFFEAAHFGQKAFFMGHFGNTGWLGYFPFTFLVKTPLPVLLGLLISLILVISRKLTLPNFLWLPPLVYMGVVCFSKIQIGHRHILSIYPFVFLMAALGLAALPGKWKWISVPLVMWLFASCWIIKPDFLPYFNELIGGPDQGHRYLSDSNIDWGQSLKSLREELEPNDLKNGIYLSYFGVADPHAYGLLYYDVNYFSMVTRHDDGDSNLNPTKFAISVTNLQMTYYDNKTIFSWLTQYQPWKKVGHSIYIYDFSAQPEALEILHQLRTS